MPFNIKTLAMINLAVQLLLLITVCAAAYLAKQKKLGSHCTVMRTAVPVQIIAIAAIMLPSFLGYIEHGTPSYFFRIETLIHHTLGLVVVILWICINLLFMGKLKTRLRLVSFMRLAFTLWMLALLLGLHMYAQIYV